MSDPTDWDPDADTQAIDVASIRGDWLTAAADFRTTREPIGVLVHTLTGDVRKYTVGPDDPAYDDLARRDAEARRSLAEFEAELFRASIRSPIGRFLAGIMSTLRRWVS